MNNNSKIIEKLLNESIESRIEEIAKKIGEIEEVDNVDLEVGSEYEYKKTDESPTKVLTFLKRGRKSSHGPFYFLDRNGNEIMLGEKQIRQMKKKETFNLSEMIHSELEEKLHGNQTKIDKNKNDKIDAEDFKLLRKGKKSEMEEELGGMDDKHPDFGEMNFSKPTKKDKEIIAKYNRNPLSLKDNKKEDEEDFETMKSRFFDMEDQEDEWEEKMGNVEESVKSNEVIYDVTFGNENVSLTENEMVDLIEEIVKEESKKSKGMVQYDRVSSKEKNINSQALKDVEKKMAQYVNGSKGKFEMNPKMFPKGNGELGEMDKKAYKASKAVEEYIENFAYSPGMENLQYDEIKPNEDWMEKNIEGHAMTGNSPDYANAVKTDLGKKINAKRKANLYGKEKNRSYNRVKQPVDVAGEGKGEDSLDKMFKSLGESVATEKQTLINEEMERMKSLLSYTNKKV